MRLLQLLLIPLLLLGCAKKGTKPSPNPPPPLPPGVYLYPPSHITGRSMLVSWSPCQDSGFSSYRLYHSTSAQVDTASELLVTDTLSSDTTFCHTGLAENTWYYYRIYVLSSDTSLRVSNPTSELTKGGDYCFYLQMGDGSGLPGGKVDMPLALVNCASLGGYEIRLTWEKEDVDSVQIRDWPYWVGGEEYHFAYFNAGLLDVGDSVQAHLVGFCQMPGNQNPPLPPSQEPDTLALFTFWLSPNWGGQPIPISFLTEKPGNDNVITDPTGSFLYCASADCPQNTCPPNPAIKLFDGQITPHP